MAKRLAIYTPWSESYTDNARLAVDLTNTKIKSLADYDMLSLQINNKCIAEIRTQDGVIISNLRGNIHKHNKRDTYKLIESFITKEMEG